MRFICDAMLGKLAKRLRLLGFDTVYARSEESLIRYRLKEGDRVVLTRRHKLAAPAGTVHIESERVSEQLREIKEMIRSTIDMDRVLRRCTQCNGELVEVDKTEIEWRVPEFVYHNYARFNACPSCGRVYWEGSHTDGMRRMIAEILA